MTPQAQGDKAALLARLPAPNVWLVGFAILLVHGSYAATIGPFLSPDSAGYARYAQQLVESGFDYPGQLALADPEFPAILYVLFVTLIALLQLGFGEGWTTALVALNLMAGTALGLLLVGLVRRVTASALAGWASLLLFLACFDLLQWLPYVLSDSTFVFIAFSIFFLVAGRILGDSRGWTGVAALAAAGIFYRPTGMVLLPDLAWAAWLARIREFTVPRVRLLLALGGTALAGASLFAWLMADPKRWPFSSFAKAFEVTAARYASGEVVEARLETFHQPPAALTDYVLISADRFLHFFAIGAADFSLAHWAAQLIFFLPCYALAGWLLIALWRGDTAYPAPVRKVFFASIGAVLAYATFHGLVLVDFDWRYRVPVLPHLILLAGGGVADLERRLSRR